MINNKIKQFLKEIKFKSKVKITFAEDLKHYRYNNHCPNCGKFKGRNHKCKIPPRKQFGWYRCSRCKKYLPYEAYQKDCTKRFGINTRCKKCRSEMGNGNKIERRKPRRRIKIRW